MGEMRRGDEERRCGEEMWGGDMRRGDEEEGMRR